MRIVHLTDLHVECTPSPAELLGKRLIGSVNLYLLGRSSHFTVAAQEAAVAAALAQRPDAVVITGDLTAQCTDGELERARALLAPLLDAVPTVILAGNHDTYVSEPAPGSRLRAVFGAWMPAGPAGLRRVGDVCFLAVETCRFHVLSSGRVPAGALAQAEALLGETGQDFVFWCQHYPLRNRHGGPYGPWTRALSNAAEVEALLARQGRVGAILHGHEHHGFRTTLETAGGPVPILDPGASGYAHLPGKGRTAHFNVYTVEAGQLAGVERFAFDGVAFQPEAGGAYASGG
jgi:3',5'-cyclic AMP phosphodiesterase CpdA